MLVQDSGNHFSAPPSGPQFGLTKDGATKNQAEGREAPLSSPNITALPSSRPWASVRASLWKAAFQLRGAPSGYASFPVPVVLDGGRKSYSPELFHLGLSVLFSCLLDNSLQKPAWFLAWLYCWCCFLSIRITVWLVSWLHKQCFTERIGLHPPHSPSGQAQAV